MTDKYNIVKAIYDDLYQTYLAKNADYGDSFGKSVRDHGLIASLVRIGDKFNRFENLVMSGDRQMVHDESIKDTLLDLANYCVMTVAEMKEKEDDLS